MHQPSPPPAFVSLASPRRLFTLGDKRANQRHVDDRPLSVRESSGRRPRTGTNISKLRINIANAAAAPSNAPPTTTNVSSTFDALIIGAGIGGLCAGALLAKAGKKVCIVEAHDTIGGAAHSFSRRTAAGEFKFESGPHLFSGMSVTSGGSHNPLRDALLACEIDLPIHRYGSWGVLLGDSDPVLETPVLKSRPFLDGLLNERGAADIQRLLDAVLPLGDLATMLSPAWLRAGDPVGSLRVAAPRAFRSALPALLRSGRNASKLSDPFQNLLNEHVTDQFTKDFMNLLCFLLAGVEADRIPTSEVAFMLREWVPPKGTTLPSPGSEDDCVLEHPVGGASGLASALASVVTNSQNGSQVRTRSRVSDILVDMDGSACGVRLRSGEEIRATEVISNALLSDTASLLPEQWKTRVEKDIEKTEMCASFMHLHVAIPKSAIKAEKLLPNYAVVRDFSQSLETPGNVSLISLPSLLDHDVCPEGFVIAHAYAPATERYELWRDVGYGSEEYDRMKVERARPLIDAMERIFGVDDLLGVAEISMIGTPLTHERFLFRKDGSYGPKVNAAGGTGLDIGIPLPGGVDFPNHLHCVGDGTFPGIGVPAVAASGWIVANGLLSIKEQERLLDRTT